MLHYLVKKRYKIVSHIVRIVGGTAHSSRTEYNGTVKLFFGSVQIQKKLQHFVDNFFITRIGAVGLIYHHDDFMSQF